MIHTSADAEKRAILQVADLIMAAARTAPKGCGVDNIETMIIDGEEKDKLAARMRAITEETGETYFGRDGNSLDKCHTAVLIGVKNIPLGLTNCSFCGFETCADTKKAGANCAFNITDMGIAIGSAVSKTADFRIDNRVMFSMGKAAVQLNYFSEDVRVAFGIPLSAEGKSLFYDREAAAVV